MKLRSRLTLLLLAVLFSGCSKHYIHHSTEGLHVVLSELAAADVSFSYSLDGYKIHPVVRSGNNQYARPAGHPLHLL